MQDPWPQKHNNDIVAVVACALAALWPDAEIALSWGRASRCSTYAHTPSKAGWPSLSSTIGWSLPGMMPQTLIVEGGRASLLRPGCVGRLLNDGRFINMHVSAFSNRVGVITGPCACGRRDDGIVVTTVAPQFETMVTDWSWCTSPVTQKPTRFQSSLGTVLRPSLAKPRT